MPIRIAFILVLLVNPICPSANGAIPEDKGRLLRFFSWCAEALGVLGKQTENGPRNATVTKPSTPTLAKIEDIAAYAKSELPLIGELSEDELKAVAAANELSCDPEWAIAFLASYTGPRDRLGLALEWNLDRLQAGAAAPRDAFPIESWLDLPGFEKVKNSWNKFKTENWRAVRDPSRLGKKQEAKVDMDLKELVFRNAISGDPKPLTVAEEIFHIESLQDAAINIRVIDGWIRELLGEVRFEKELSQVDQYTRYDWRFLAQYKALLETIPPIEVQRALVFLVERDAMLKNLEIYRELIKTHPEFKNSVWDDLAASKFPAAKASSLLNQQERFKLNPKFVEKLDRYTLDSVIHALGGQTVAERDEQKARDSAPPPARPAFLSPTQRVDWKVISDLDEADRIVGSNKAVEAGLYELQRDRNPDTTTGGITRWIATAAEKAALAEKPEQGARDPHAIAKFIDVLVDSPAFRGFTVDTNSAGAIQSILQAAQRLAPEHRPNPEKVARMVMGFIQVNGTPGIAGRETGSTALNLHMAEGAAKSAAAYFRAVGDETRAEHWSAIAADAEENLQRDLRDSREKREGRRS